MRYGILGGTFNPVHKGHIYCAELAIKKLQLNKIFFIPAFISPFKANQSENYISPELRLKMLNLILKPKYCIIDFEIRKKGISYTIDTIKFINDKYNCKKENLFLLIGSDNLLSFNNWFKYDEILKLINLAVIERKAFPLSECKIKNYINLGISKYDISSSDIRKKLKNQNYNEVSKFIPKKVMEFIKYEKIYQ